jgi:hypothetical protein
LKLRDICVLAVFLILGSVIPGRAAGVDEIARDFRPLSGYVIMPLNDQYLIDQDAAKGVVVGDLFSVIEVGEKIVHPVTKEVLGTLDHIKGVLQVTQVKTGYSYARPLGKVEELRAGEIIRRYDNIPAIFWDYTGQGSGLFAQLKDSLPNLNWLDYAAAQAERPVTPGALTASGPSLLFVLGDRGLEVHDAGYRIIHAYPRAEPTPAAGAVRPVPPVVAATPPPPVAVSASPGPLKWEQTLAGGGKGANGYQTVYPGFETVDSLPDGTVMAVFAQDGDRFLLATTDRHSIQVFTVSDRVKHLAQGHPSLPGQVLALHWWQPVTQGPLYLAVTSAVEVNQATSPVTPHTVSGEVFQLQDGRLTRVDGELPYLLGTFDRDGDGVNETLLGQNFDRDIFFGSRIKEFHLAGGKIESAGSTLELPRSFPVQGSLLADLTGDGHPEEIFVRRRVMSIYAGTRLLYESPQQMGGSLSAMTFNRNPDAVDQLFTTEAIEIPPVAADLDGDGRPEVVAIAAEGSFLRAPGLGPNISKTWLSVFHYANGGFVRGKLGDDLESPIVGLTVAGKRVLLVSTQSGSVLSRKGKSYLLAIPLGK